MIFLVIVLIFWTVIIVVNFYLASEKYNGPTSDHFNGSQFFNKNFRQNREMNFFSVIKWMMNRPKKEWKMTLPGVFTKPRERVYGSELVVTYVNHSTVLVQTEGLNFLTDPIWSKRSSPVNFAGPARHQAPGIKFEDLPPIDVVLVSHNHYDHMDLLTLRRLQKHSNPKILVGLGNAAYLQKRKISNVFDLDWWQKISLNENVVISAVPAQHFSSRSLSDRNRTLWVGFVVETPHGRIYFAGDTGYGSFVEEIRSRMAPFRLALLPIGAHLPEWFMKPVHISPAEAVKMYEELSVKTGIGIHFGTYHLADDGQFEPKKELENIINGKESHFVTLQNGESMQVPEM